VNCDQLHMEVCCTCCAVVRGGVYASILRSLSGALLGQSVCLILCNKITTSMSVQARQLNLMQSTVCNKQLL
jgi:hypothetical protein